MDTVLRVGNACGVMIRHWRASRAMSQLSLATAAGVSARHLSFIESGRSRPSREMLLVLSRALGVPLDGQNALLRAGGFNEAFGRRALDDPQLKALLAALRFMLERMEPYPCSVLDQHWNLLDANLAAFRLLGSLFPEIDPEGLNVARLLFSEPVRKAVIDWESFAGSFIQRLHREALESAETRTLLDELLETPGIPKAWATLQVNEPTTPFLPLLLRRGDQVLRLMTTITTLGTPLDVTAQSLRIETYLPADAQTEQLLRDAAEAAGG